MSSDNLMTNNEIGAQYIKINKNLSMNPSAAMLYGIPPPNGVPPRTDIIDPKLRTLLAQLPSKERPDISLMQHLVKQNMTFSIPIKKKPPPVHQKQISYIQPIPPTALKPSQQQQHVSYKRLQPAATTTNIWDPARMMNFKSVPDALEALKIPSPNSPSSTAHFPIYPIYPSSYQRSSMSPTMINNSQPSRSSINQLQPKKRARVKMLHPAAVATSSAGITEKPPTKKYKPRKSSTPAALTDYSHSSSEPPQSAPLTKNEKSSTPTLNEDYTVRRSGRKVIKPAHLAADIGISGNNGEKYSNNYDSNTNSAATVGGSTNEENKNYDECAAVLPDLIEQIDLAKIEDTVKDLDELTIIPKNMENLDEQDLKKYVLACQAKVKCDAHIAFVHLAANDFCIKKALETFDLKDSLPKIHLAGKDSTGIWTSDDLKTFVRLMNNNKCYKRMHKISKHISDKSTANVVNAYYALKKGVCSFGREFTICPEIIDMRYRNPAMLVTQKPVLDFEYVDSTKCENCVKQLWQKSDIEEFDSKSLCSLCKLYHSLYQKLRPNAESTPQIFDDTRLKHDACSYEMMKDDFDEIFIPDWNAFKMNVYKIKSTLMKDFAEAVKDLKLDQNTQNLLNESEKWNENYTYIFFSEKPLTNNVPQFYPKNGIPLFECLSFTDPPKTSSDSSKESSASKSPTPATATSKNLGESDDENDGPPILVNEMERNFKEKQIIEKPFDVFFFGYFDDKNEFHNEHGIEFHHAYLEKLLKFSDSICLPLAKKDDGKPLGSCAEKDLADKKVIEKYGNISFAVFSQNL
uniref:ELM2 domain-containing protein n=1 Tax=Panagrolaimus davidi TaxID=227884 RepID=A0A914P7L2_9BILA